MTDIGPGEVRGRWEALDDLEVARKALKSVSDLAWLWDSDAPNVAALIRRTYEAFPELDLLVSQQGLAKRIAAVAKGDKLSLDGRLLVALLARTVDPGLRTLTELAVTLATQARAWDIAVQLAGSSSSQNDSVLAVDEPDSALRGNLAYVAQLIPHLPRRLSGVRWHISDHVGEEIESSVPVDPGARVTSDPWQTTDLFVQGRTLIESGSLQVAQRAATHADADVAGSIASARYHLTSIFAREITSGLPARAVPQPKERVCGRMHFVDLISSQELCSIPARLLRFQHSRSSEQGEILIDQTSSDRLVYGPYCRLAAGTYHAKLIGHISGSARLRFAVVAGSRTFAMSSTAEEGRIPAGTERTPRELAVCSFFLSHPVEEVEFIVEDVLISGEMLISAVDLCRSTSLSVLPNKALTG